MRKSIQLKIEASGVMSATILASTFLFSSFIGTANVVSQSQSRWLVVLSIAIVLIGVVVALLLWLRGSKIAVIERREIISAIPKALTSMHEKRGEATEKYINDSVQENNLSDLSKMIMELFQFLSGQDVEKKLSSDSFGIMLDAIELASTKTELSESALAILLAKSSQTHLPIDKNLAQEKDYKKSLNTVVEAKSYLPKNTVMQATKDIDTYITFSEGYWALDALILWLTKENVHPMMGTALNIYKDTFQKQMNLKLAKVCEDINEYAV